MEYTNKQEPHDSSYYIKYVTDLFNEAKNYRSSKVEKQWMVNYAWFKGWQNLKYNTVTNRFVWEDSDPTKFYVNKVYSIVRAVRGVVTQYQPVFDVDGLPYGATDEKANEVVGNYLLDLSDRLDMKTKNKELVLFGLLYGIGLVQFGYDKQLENGQGEVWVDILDPFDTYIDPVATTIAEARYIIKVVRKPLEVIQANPAYNKEAAMAIQGDGRFSASEYKERLMSRDNVNLGNNKTALLYEAHCVVKDHVEVITICGMQMLRQEVTDYKTLDEEFAAYQPDINPNELIGEGWVKNMIPLNRAINNLERSTLEFHNIFAKGRFIKKGNTGITSVTNDNGKIISVDPGADFSQLDMKPMTSSVFNQISALNGYLGDIGGAQDVLLGRAPTGVTAAVAFEQLVANNMGVLKDLVDNFEIVQTKIGNALLKLAYKYYDTTRWFKYKGGNGETEVMAVIGQGQQMPPINGTQVVSLPELAKVKVKIVSGVGYTKAGRMDTMFQLRKGGDVSRWTLLEQLGLDAAREQERIQEENMPPAPPMPPMQPQGLPQGMPVGQSPMPPANMMPA